VWSRLQKETTLAGKFLRDVRKKELFNKNKATPPGRRRVAINSDLNGFYHFYF
jgi:hypothetical protein